MNIFRLMVFEAQCNIHVCVITFCTVSESHRNVSYCNVVFLCFDQTVLFHLQSPRRLLSVVLFDILAPEFTIDDVSLKRYGGHSQKLYPNVRAQNGSGFQFDNLVINPTDKVHVKVSLEMLRTIKRVLDNHLVNPQLRNYSVYIQFRNYCALLVLTSLLLSGSYICHLLQLASPYLQTSFQKAMQKLTTQ